ncbi:ribonuclease [Solihabitans fulvus]|uniref:Ribonuclease n=1 Tax=Solihabitans fulvus TaxID=1892852 RepID=A0A5B2WSP7_9PSEU|nr:ribonuclease [Solihabitans fulvus]KAA2253586.1 ribonuclease [Solihabitans fulvus]
MSYLTSRAAKVVLGALLAIVGTFGLASAPATAAPATTATTATASALSAFQASCGDTSGFSTSALSSLPPEATDTVNLIQQGGPFPYPRNDGVVFQNREGVLPACARGYYHEYTVITPGSSTRGARRIITGDAGEYFYTDDHYASFVLVDIAS